jgi:hypothetical protein
MQIAIIGAGKVGIALARNWARAGHRISFGVRDPAAEKHAALRSIGERVEPAQAATKADVIVLAVPWPAVAAAVAGLGDIAGKIVLDCTNPLTMGPQGLALAIGHSDSGGERTAALAPSASVFKVLNTTGDNNLGDPGRYPLKPVMLIAGDDGEKKPMVAKLVADLGFEPVDAGPMVNARLLEAHAMLWIDLSRNRGLPRDIAFALMRRDPAR